MADSGPAGFVEDVFQAVSQDGVVIDDQYAHMSWPQG
jgi:hypothetical protein